ncbi:amidase [Aliishimia ponticola]|uniref:Amidase n=1 Tax=Aliishimia ponticola TaxID=2499833 RepID=A0A4V3XL04_9RHOB|nr:amidase [Aliishimia ponticola]THH38933.1 amidase [Aliishimia ponticola]
MSDLLEHSGLELSALIAGKDVSCAEVMDATLTRIEAVNGPLNAITSLRDRDALMDEARQADKAEPQGWLHGIPMAIKDLAAAKGLPNTMGSPVFADQIAGADDIHVARLRAAGAIFIGKTNVPEFGLGSHTFNPVFGATANPYAPGRTCGGSSGGAAVALAARMVSVADGSDMMGSLRNPAAWNNVYGMRPTEGVIPSEPRGDTYLQRLSTNGPMARSPRDLAALLDTMGGPDPRQPFGISLPLTLPEISAQVTGRWIGWLGDWGGAYPMDAGILALCETALRQMEEIGLSVENLAPPCAAEEIWEPWKGLRHFAVASSLGPLFDNPETRGKLKQTAQWEIENGRALSAQDISRLSAMRSLWFQRAAKLAETYDALVLPSAQVWPFDVDTEYPQQIAGQGMDTYHRWMEVVIPASLIGLPVVNVPIGFSDDGLPMGLQLIGPRGGDGRLLQLAESWHAATDWPGRCPPTLAT